MNSQDMKKISVLCGFLLVIFLTVFVWHKLLGQAFLGEGATYLVEPYANQLFRSGIWEIIRRYDLQALLFFRIFGNLAKDNMKFYMGFLLGGIIFVNCNLYALVKEITKSTLAGVISAALFISGFIGSFEMLGIGVYPYFIQRVPNFGFALISFIFLVKFLQSKKAKYYLWSFIFYALAMFLAHYTLLILPVFLFYIIGSFLLKDFKNIKNWYSAIVCILPFAVWSFFLYQIEPRILVMDESFLHFLFERHQLISDVLAKLTILTFPQNLISFVAKDILSFLFADVRTYPYFDAIKVLSYLVTVLYLAVTVFVTVKYKKYRLFVLVLFVSIPVSIIMALYLRINIINEFSSSRYLYLPSMIVSMFWGLIFFLLLKEKIFLKIFSLVLLTYLFLFGRFLIISSFNEIQPKCDVVLSTISFVKNNYKNFPDNSLIIFPKYQGSYHTQMLERFYGERNIRFLTIDDDFKAVLKKISNKKVKVFALIYNSGKIILQEKKI